MSGGAGAARATATREGVADAPPAKGHPLALYVHWPFCQSKCPYCDFNSHIAGDIDHQRYLRAYESEMRHMAALHGRGRRLVSLFIGGGTPSLMPAWLVERIIEGARDIFGFDADIEITAEANPGSADSDKFLDFARAGVNRLSIGVQSLDDAHLAFLGRRHSAGEALGALEAARRVFARVSIDLIYAHRHHTQEGWRRELETAIALGLDHYSLYQLTIERGTAFYARARTGETLTAHDGLAADLYEMTGEMMSGAGLDAYEISNHARPGAACRHNLVYWRAHDWLGTGPGAHGRVSHRGGRRGLATHRSPAGWLDAVDRNGHGIQEVVDDDAAQSFCEYMMMGLRLEDGVCVAEMRARFDDANGFIDGDALGRLVDAQFLDLSGGRMRATGKGRLVLNSVLGDILNVESAERDTSWPIGQIPAGEGPV